MYFLPEEHKQIYENIFEEYYSSDKIEKLELPKFQMYYQNQNIGMYYFQ